MLKPAKRTGLKQSGRPAAGRGGLALVLPERLINRVIETGKRIQSLEDELTEPLMPLVVKLDAELVDKRVKAKNLGLSQTPLSLIRTSSSRYALLNIRSVACRTRLHAG